MGREFLAPFSCTFFMSVVVLLQKIGATMHKVFFYLLILHSAIHGMQQKTITVMITKEEESQFSPGTVYSIPEIVKIRLEHEDIKTSVNPLESATKIKLIRYVLSLINWDSAASEENNPFHFNKFEKIRNCIAGQKLTLSQEKKVQEKNRINTIKNYMTPVGYFALGICCYHLLLKSYGSKA